MNFVLIRCTQHLVHSGEHLTLSCMYRNGSLENIVDAAPGLILFLCF